MWKQSEAMRADFRAWGPATTPVTAKPVSSSPKMKLKRRIRVLLSVNVNDLESQTGYGNSELPVPSAPQYFVENTAIPRLVKILKKHDLADKTT